MDDVLAHSITYRIAVGPRAGQKLFMLQMLAAKRPERDGVARAGGFTLHAGVDIAVGQRAKLERMCRYALKTPYRDGTTHVVLYPLDLMARLAALVPPPRRT